MKRKLISKILLSLLLASALPVLSSPGVLAGLLDWPYNLAPTEQAEVVLTTSGEAVLLDADRLEAELGVTGLAGVTLTRLPESGTLTLDGKPAACWQHISREALGDLRYEPDGGAASCSLSLMLELPDSVPASLTIRQTGGSCPPVVTAAEVITAQGNAAAGWVRAWDQEGGALTASVVKAPQKGKLTLNGLSWRYEPYPGKSGDDSFTLVITDADGNRSADAVYPVRIEKKTLPVYQDLAGSDIAYSAGKLAESMIFLGEQIGGISYFRPEKPVTRGELICLLLAVCDIKPAENAVTTGLASGESAVPYWLRPAVAAAVEREIITEGAFDPDEIPTFAEMAVYAVRACGLEKAGGNPSWTDLQEVPDWALESFLALDSAGVLNTPDGALHPNEPLTRGRMADLLWQCRQWTKAGK